MSRLHSVDNLVATKYAAQESNVVQGATATFTYVDSVDAAQANTLYAIFVAKDFQSDEKLAAAYPAVDWAAMAPLFEAQNFTGAAGNATVVNKDGKPVFVLGMGAKPNNEKIRSLSQAIISKARDQKRDNVVVYLPQSDIIERDELVLGYGKGVKGTEKTKQAPTVNCYAQVVDIVIRGLLYNNWAHDLFLQEPVFTVKNFTLVGEHVDGIHKVVADAVHGAESVTFARELGSLRFSVANNTYMKDTLVKLAEAHSDVFKIKVVAREQLMEEEYRLICAVNQGSWDPCYIVCIEYTPPGFVETEENKRPHAFVAKTLTFDTGGYDLKPPAGMLDMHCDKHAGCNQLGVFRYLGLTRPNTSKRLVGVWTITDNEIGSKAVHPHTIISTASVRGANVSCAIDNTDAEGRLALADAVTLVQKYYNPAKIVTQATLTGAILITLGHNMTGLFTNSPALPQEICALGELTGERFWHLPILADNHKDLAGKDCDIKNITGARWMGSSVAAAFIEYFVGNDVEYVHLDIAGTSSTPGNEAAGTPVNTLQKYAARQ